MNETSPETLSVVLEREASFPPEKIRRALTQPQLIEEWLMKNDLTPVYTPERTPGQFLVALW